MAADLFHQWGADLQWSATGDLLTASGQDLGTQRVLRRLLTNPGDAIFHLDYGAGLPAFVGQPANPARIAAVVRTQMRKEAAVSARPAPSVDVTAQDNGTTYAHVRYADAETGASQTLTLPVG